MANLSLRGLDHPTLSRLKSNARRRGISVNRLIVETLREQYANAGQTFDDLDRLAGTWSTTEATAFAEAVAPLAEVDPSLWAAEPKPAYRVKPGVGRKAPK
jgi:phosphopantetheinyl transferase (holo-ACP synthase)